MPRVGKRRVKRHTHKTMDDGDEKLKKTPKCFVVKHGKKVGSSLQSLVKDFRTVMAPNCAERLNERKRNKVRDYVAVANHLHVSHLNMFTQTDSASYVKIGRIPQGPTITFKLKEFSLIQDIKTTQKRPRHSGEDHLVPPLLALNGMNNTKDPDVKLVAEVIRNMFPQVDLGTFSTKSCRRVAMFNYDEKTEELSFRHYAIAETETDISRGIEKLLRGSQNRKIKSLGPSKDVGNFVLSGGAGESDSEQEDAVPIESSRRTKKERKLPAALQKKQKAIRLVEIGPRMTMQLVKGEEGLMEGTVLFHKFIEKTPEEQELMVKKAMEQRRRQEANENEDAKETERKKDIQERTLNNKLARSKMDFDSDGNESDGDAEDDADDDAEEQEEEEEKKKPSTKHNPFAWARGKAEKDDIAAAKKEGRKDTVEFGDSNTQKKRVKEEKQKQLKKAAKLKKKGAGKGGKGAGKGGKGGSGPKKGKAGVMDRFNRAVKK